MAGLCAYQAITWAYLGSLAEKIYLGTDSAPKISQFQGPVLCPFSGPRNWASLLTFNKGGPVSGSRKWTQKLALNSYRFLNKSCNRIQKLALNVYDFPIELATGWAMAAGRN